MTSALLSQSVIEVLTSPDPDPRISQTVVEVIRTDPKLALLAHTVVEVIMMGREISIGGRESIQDDAYQFYGGYGCEGDLNEREKQRLGSLGFDDWYSYLRSIGYTGSVSDMKLAWLRANGFTGSLNDALLQYYNS